MAGAGRTTQVQRVKRYIEDFGSITSLEAIRDLWVTRLSAIVFKLKKAGVQVEGKTEHSVNRYGENTTFKRYLIVGQQPTNTARV